jgi:hypothetical protein
MLTLKPISQFSISLFLGKKVSVYEKKTPRRIQSKIYRFEVEIAASKKYKDNFYFIQKNNIFA